MIQAKNISKSFTIGKQKLPVLKNISLAVEAGEFVSLMGPSGSGRVRYCTFWAGLIKQIPAVLL